MSTPFGGWLVTRHAVRAPPESPFESRFR
jgi:hypothetical protein